MIDIWPSASREFFENSAFQGMCTPPQFAWVAIGLTLVVAFVHSQVLAIFSSTVFTSNHPYIESIQSTLNKHAMNVFI